MFEDFEDSARFDAYVQEKMREENARYMRGHRESGRKRYGVFSFFARKREGNKIEGELTYRRTRNGKEVSSPVELELKNGKVVKATLPDGGKVDARKRFTGVVRYPTKKQIDELL